MTVRERLLTIKLTDKIKNDPEYAKKIGIYSTAKKTDDNRSSKINDLILAKSLYKKEWKFFTISSKGILYKRSIFMKLNEKAKKL